MDESRQIFDSGQTNTASIKEHISKDRGFWNNEKEATSNQNESNSQFLETLAQSLGEAFQIQNTHVVESSSPIFAENTVVEPRIILEQIIEQIKVSVVKEEAQMTIQLKPEHLGKLSMEVVSKQGIMTARFTVESEQTKEVLEQNIQALKEVLENRNLIIEELEVTVGQNHQEDNQNNKNPKSNKNISQIIDEIMNDDIVENDIDITKRHKSETNEVDFTA